mmetsp:Transcript_73624/g.203242  ORF Transcript_73624/g.203242 Transcript_73624/m.203242 type:complete len:279 (-) Transcript_73624:396-1232(-)
MPRRSGLENLLDPADHLVLVEVADDIKSCISGIVPLVVEVAQVLLLPGLDLLLLADRELRAELVGLVKPGERPSLDPVLHVVHLLHLGQHRLPFLLYAALEHLWCKGDLVQRLQRRKVHAAAVLQLHRRVDVVDCVLEVGERVGARTSADQTLTLAAAQEADVLHHVCNALLVRLLIDAAHMQLDVRLEALGWHDIPQDDVPKAVWEDAPAHPGVGGERLLGEALRSLWPLDEAAPRRVPVRLPVQQTQCLDLVRQRHALAGGGRRCGGGLLFARDLL